MAKNIDTETVQNYVIGLRDDQWDLIVLAMQNIRKMANNITEPRDSFHNLSRLFLKRRCDEVIADIQAVVDTAGEK